MFDKTLVSLLEENEHPVLLHHRYTGFGLTISSCMPCPELVPFDGGDADADVTVRYGDVPPALPGARHTGVRHQAFPGQLLLRVDGIARFLVREGQEIIIARNAVASDDDVRLFLLGSVFGALLHQRGNLVLHGSMVKVDDGCVLCLGKSGVGKSTLAAALVRRGYPGLSDALSVLSIGEDGVPYAVPAYPQAQLWTDSLRRLGIDAKGLRRVRPALEKRAWPFEAPSGREPIPVRRLFVLTRSRTATTLESKPIEGPAKMKVLRELTYREGFLQGLALGVPHFRQIAHLCSRLTVTLIVRPQNAFLLDELASLVEGIVRT